MEDVRADSPESQSVWDAEAPSHHSRLIIRHTIANSSNRIFSITKGNCVVQVQMMKNMVTMAVNISRNDSVFTALKTLSGPGRSLQ